MGKYNLALAAIIGVSVGCSNIMYYQKSNIQPVKLNVGILGHINDTLEITTPSGKKMYYKVKITDGGIEEVRYIKTIIGDLEKKAVTKISEKE